MPRKRIVYQSEALYAGTTGELSPVQLHRIQDFTHSLDMNRTDINEFGYLAALGREIVEPPLVGLDFTYYVVDGYNEASGLGFSVNGQNTTVETSALSGFMVSNSSGAEKNWYLLTVPDGEDASKTTAGYYSNAGSGNGTIGIGNGYITSYTLDASVGDIPTASVSVEANNIRFDIGSSGIPNPAVKVLDGAPLGEIPLWSLFPPRVNCRRLPCVRETLLLLSGVPIWKWGVRFYRE